MKRCLQLFTAFLFLAPAVFAQTHREQVTVNVVEVPVYIERFFGGTVQSLQKEDFELYVNGARHPVDYFDVLDEQTLSPVTVTAAPKAKAPAALYRRRLMVLLFDVVHSSFIGIRRAKDAATRYVEQAPPGDTFAVATLGRSGTRFLVPFTNDRVAVQRAIATLAPSMARDPFNLAIVDAERIVWGAGTRGPEAGSGSFSELWQGTGLGFSVSGSRSAATAVDALDAARRFEEQESALRVRDLTGEHGLLAERLAPLTGIKHVVLLTTGWSDGGDRHGFFQDANRMHDRYRDAGVILDAVDVTPPRAPGGNALSRGADPFGSIAAMLGPPDALYSLALDTGGVVVSTMSRLETVYKVTYVLGFRPRGPQKKRNEIRVRVRNLPWGTMVRHRPSYSLEGDARPKENEGLFLADVLMNDIPQNGMTVDLAVTPEEKTALVAASVPGPELLADASGKPVLLEVFLYVFNDRNLIAGWSHAKIVLDLEKAREFLSANPYTIRKEFELLPGRYAMKALVRIVGTDITGFQRAEFEVAAN